jgi:sialic acid synthase SpsE
VIRLEDDRLLGGGNRCFVIAEAGVNHNGDPDRAHALIDAAADAAADAVKFQTFDPEALAATSAPTADYQKKGGSGSNQVEMLRALTLPRSVYPDLQAHARQRNILFLSSPFDEASADFLLELGLPALKVASGELTNHGFLAKLARAGKPLLVSTGMSTAAEVGEALRVIREAGRSPVALFHCVSNYPASPAEANLRAMDAMRQAFEVPVGWSDHTEGIELSVAAAALGAELLEKHLTTDRNLPGPDHRASLEPGELARLVRSVRDVEAALGTGEKVPTASERVMATVARKSLHLGAALPAGAILAARDLVALRPGSGIPPSRLGDVVGRRLRRGLPAGAMLDENDLEPRT